MKISYNWLKEYIALPETPEDIGKVLTSTGLEVESIEVFEQVNGGLKGVVIGEVLTCQKHPNADKLSLTTVDAGGENPLSIVCGAPNVAAGQKVLVATIDTLLYPTEGDPFTIKKSKIRGELSEGMICAEDELGLGLSHEGIMVLDTDLPNGTPAAAYFNLESDFVFEIGLTPNRADATSHYGVARDLKAAYSREICLASVDDFKVQNQDLNIEVKVENTEACPRYTGLTIKGLSVKPSPEWLQNRLRAIGLKPINNIVDITNYIQHDLGQPLHAFDANEITEKTIIVKTLPQNTAFVTLDEIERKLSENDLMICDGEGKGMCIGGVFGGIKSGVSEKTTSIFLESAYFSPEYIRRTAQYHGLKTDASFRFERGTDPNMPVYALKKAALLIQEIAGGEISSEIKDIYPSPIANFEFEVTYKNIDRLIGIKIERETIKKILRNLDIVISEENETGFKVSVPPYRVDVQREADIIEEIARIYGYDNIDVGNVLGATYLAEFPDTDPNKLRYQISQLLAANGFNEMVNNSLTKPSYSEALSSVNTEENVEILNKLSEDLGVMRQTLLFSGLETLSYNINRRQKDLKFFEFGRTYRKKGNEGSVLDKYEEKNRLSLFITGNRQAESWMTKTTPVTFQDISSAVLKVLQKMNVVSVKSSSLENDIFEEGLVYELNNKPIVTLGLIKTAILKILDIKQAVYYADIDWDYLLKKYKSEVVYEEVSRFPSVRRDLSLILDKQITYQEIERLALSKERNLIKEVNVFDVYQGPNIGEGKKSYSVSFLLEDKTQTLTDKVIDKVMNKLIDAFEKEMGALIKR